MPRPAEVLSVRGATLVEFVHSLLEQRIGAWSFGVQGAVAEFIFGADAEVQRTGPTIEVLTAEGGLRLTLPDDTRAFADVRGQVLLAVPRASLPDCPAGLAVAGADGAALRAADREAILVDLGIGSPAARFCVRTKDPALLAELSGLRGASLGETLSCGGDAILTRSPHRVVTTPLGRCEVFSAIPPIGGRSPDGPHTHLLPASLAEGRDLAAQAIPREFVSPVVFHPPPGWKLPSPDAFA